MRYRYKDIKTFVMMRWLYETVMPKRKVVYLGSYNKCVEVESVQKNKNKKIFIKNNKRLTKKKKSQQNL